MRRQKATKVAAAITLTGCLLALPGPAGALASRPFTSRSPAPAFSPTIKPPVITEEFKPALPCNVNTTVGMIGCGEHKVLAADAVLDADVKMVFGLLYDNAARHRLIAAQTAWLAYRTADCQSQSDIYEGGTEANVVAVYCLAADDASRRTDLKGLYSGLVQGRTTKPVYP
jgi:uncharacterized protein YecT (DUF1311 family)